MRTSFSGQAKMDPKAKIDPKKNNNNTKKEEQKPVNLKIDEENFVKDL